MAYYSDVVFDENDLSAITGFNITHVTIDAPPTINIDSAKLARQPGMKLFNKEYGGRRIDIRGVITRNSRADYLTTRSEILRKTEKIEKVLEVPVDFRPLDFHGVTLENAIFEDASGGYGAVTLTFTCSDPFAYDRYSTVLVNETSVTSDVATVSYSESIGGDYRTPPYIRLTISALTGGSDKYIKLTNQAGEYIQVTRTWADDDVLVIDAQNHTVQVNGLDVDYSGTFWPLHLDETEVSYEDSLTTRSATLYMHYKRRSL